jgi:hypothetical protein
MARNQFTPAISRAQYVNDLLENRSEEQWDDLHVTPCLRGRGAGFSYNSSGYCRVNLDGGKLVAHVLVLEATSGKPRPDNTDASHLCGHAWCFNPAHLTWEDRAANISRRGCAGKVLAIVDGKRRWVQVCRHAPLCQVYTRGTQCADPVTND